MPERGYFSLRYAIPGYTFILVVVGINYFPLTEFITKTGAPEFFGAILAFISLLTGSALGFLISQFWWWWFHMRGGFFGTKGFKQEELMLTEEYKLVLPNESKERRNVAEAILDFAMGLEKKERISELIWRRWDMYHLLSATFHTLWVGVAVGIVYRLSFEHFLYKTFGLKLILEGKISPWQKAESVFLLLLFVGVCVLLFLFWRSRRNLIDKFYPLHKALVRRSLQENMDELTKAFPSYFPKQKEPQNS